MNTAEFKDSPLGPIPQDWEVKRLGDLCSITTGHKDVNEGSELGLYPFFTCSRNVYRANSYSFDGEAILIAGNGEVGNLHYYDGKFEAYQRTYVLMDFSVNVAFLRQYLSAFLMRELMDDKTGSSMPYIVLSALSNCPIPYPSEEEQQRIAEALGEVDKLIESLDEQIEKKRLIAKGVAHDLLSGAKRLPGFKGEWKSVRLGELSEIVTGGTPSTEVPAFWGGDIRWMNSGDVHLKRIHDVDGRITQLGYASSNARLIPIGSVVIALAGQGKTRGTAAITECELCTNQSIGAILPSEKHDSECLYYVLAMQYEKLRAASSGDGTRGGLSKKILEEYIVKLPVDIAEQQAIADLLSEQDAAIAALEEKREKYARIKDGMMRDMLTGKVRI